MPEKNGSTNEDANTALAPQTEDIKSLILTVRGRQVLLDSDVARLYGYETKAINQAAARNKERFPPEFRFQLTDKETDEVLRSQFVTSNNPDDSRSQATALITTRGGRRYRPFVFSEQGIGMLSGVLKNSIAVQVSINIMNAFVEMRRFIGANKDVFAKLVSIDNKLLDHDRKFDEVFDLLQAPEAVKQSIFFKGEFYDAFKLILDIISKARASIIIVDNYTDDSVLEMLADKATGVAVAIVTSNPSKLSTQHLKKFSQQHGAVPVIESKDFHDRFIILDGKDVYAFGASLKDAGNKCFGVWKMEDTAGQLISHINQVVRHKLPKLALAGSNPVTHSKSAC